MNFQIITAFENMFEGAFSEGLLGTAVKKKLIAVDFINPRSFTADIHQSIDDRPFGGGDGMLMSIPPLKSSIEYAKDRSPETRVVYLNPQGKPFSQKKAEEYAQLGSVTLICGRYAGIDERLIAGYVDEELSLGDFIMTGAEVAAMAVVDATARLVPGVLGNEQSAKKESFGEDGLLEWPQFTRPREMEDLAVPEILLSGDHKKIEAWRRDLSILRSLDRRPDLIRAARLSPEELKSAKLRFEKMSQKERFACGLGDLDGKLSDF